MDNPELRAALAAITDTLLLAKRANGPGMMPPPSSVVRGGLAAGSAAPRFTPPAGGGPAPGALRAPATPIGGGGRVNYTPRPVPQLRYRPKPQPLINQMRRDYGQVRPQIAGPASSPVTLPSGLVATPIGSRGNFVAPRPDGRGPTFVRPSAPIDPAMQAKVQQYKSEYAARGRTPEWYRQNLGWDQNTVANTSVGDLEQQAADRFGRKLTPAEMLRIRSLREQSLTAPPPPSPPPAAPADPAPLDWQPGHGDVYAPPAVMGAPGDMSLANRYGPKQASILDRLGERLPGFAAWYTTGIPVMSYFSAALAAENADEDRRDETFRRALGQHLLGRTSAMLGGAAAFGGAKALGGSSGQAALAALPGVFAGAMLGAHGHEALAGPASWDREKNPAKQASQINPRDALLPLALVASVPLTSAITGGFGSLLAPSGHKGEGFRRGFGAGMAGRTAGMVGGGASLASALAAGAPPEAAILAGLGGGAASGILGHLGYHAWAGPPSWKRPTPQDRDGDGVARENTPQERKVAMGKPPYKIQRPLVWTNRGKFQTTQTGGPVKRAQDSLRMLPPSLPPSLPPGAPAQPMTPEGRARLDASAMRLLGRDAAAPVLNAQAPEALTGMDRLALSPGRKHLLQQGGRQGMAVRNLLSASRPSQFPAGDFVRTTAREMLPGAVLPPAGQGRGPGPWVQPGQTLMPLPDPVPLPADPFAVEVSPYVTVQPPRPNSKPAPEPRLLQQLDAATQGKTAPVPPRPRTPAPVHRPAVDPSLQQQLGEAAARFGLPATPPAGPPEPPSLALSSSAGAYPRPPAPAAPRFPTGSQIEEAGRRAVQQLLPRATAPLTMPLRPPGDSLLHGRGADALVNWLTRDTLPNATAAANPTPSVMPPLRPGGAADSAPGRSWLPYLLAALGAGGLGAGGAYLMSRGRRRDDEDEEEGTKQASIFRGMAPTMTPQPVAWMPSRARTVTPSLLRAPRPRGLPALPPIGGTAASPARLATRMRLPGGPAIARPRFAEIPD